MVTKSGTFLMNGHPFHVDTNISSKSELNISKTPMYVPKKGWGYNYLQWNSFSGEEIDVVVYNHTWEKYTGTKALPDSDKFTTEQVYDDWNLSVHGSLKYWAQNFVTVNVQTTLEAIEPGKYKITEFEQKQVTFDVIETTMTLTQYEQEDMAQTYWKVTTTGNTNKGDTSSDNATAKQVMALHSHAKTCTCDKNSDPDKCTSSPNDEVKTIQKYLRRLGYYPSYNSIVHKPLTFSGRFCYWTQEAIREFQKANKITVSGAFDETTKKKMKDLLCPDDSESKKKTTTTTS